MTDNKYEEDDRNNAGRVKAALLLSVLALLSGNDLCKINDSMGKYAKEDNSTELNVTQAHRWGLVLRVLLGQDAAHHSMVHLSKGEHKSLTCHISNPLCQTRGPTSELTSENQTFISNSSSIQPVNHQDAASV